MIESIRYRWRLSRLQKKRRWIKSQYKKDVQNARLDKKSHQRILEIYADEANEIDIIDSEIGSLVSQTLLEEADYRFLSRPDFNDKDNWVSYSVTGTSHLSAKAITDLRERIDKNKNERWQFYELRLKLLVGIATAVTGVVGSLIGLIATWK